MAAAAAQFVDKLLRGLSGENGITAYAFVSTSVTGVEVKGLEFFSSCVKIGRNGIAEPLPIGPLSPFERAGVETMAKELGASIAKGRNFVSN